MVKYGYCKLYCKECGAGVAIQTNIQRDKSWEKNIISTKCAHFEFWCDLYTYDSFNPYKDQIQFKTFAKCLRCEQVNEESISCIGFENRENTVHKECVHKHTSIHEFRLYSNTSSDYAVNTVLFSFGLYGTLAKYISKKIGDHLELYVFTDNETMRVESFDDLDSSDDELKN